MHLPVQGGGLMTLGMMQRPGPVSVVQIAAPLHVPQLWMTLQSSTAVPQLNVPHQSALVDSLETHLSAWRFATSAALKITYSPGTLPPPVPTSELPTWPTPSSPP